MESWLRSVLLFVIKTFGKQVSCQAIRTIYILKVQALFCPSLLVNINAVTAFFNPVKEEDAKAGFVTHEAMVIKPEDH